VKIAGNVRIRGHSCFYRSALIFECEQDAFEACKNRCLYSEGDVFVDSATKAPLWPGMRENLATNSGTFPVRAWAKKFPADH